MAAYPKHSQKGQAFAELSIILFVLCLLVFGAIEFGRMISLSSRMASVAREGGRMVNALEYDSTQMNSVFQVAQGMIQPANLATGGKIIVSFVQRVPGNSTNLSVASTNDVLIITDRFYYPNTGNTRVLAASAPSWPTTLPTAYTNASGKYIPFQQVGRVTLNLLQVNGMTSVVEVFHTNTALSFLQNFGVSIPTYLYDAGVF